MPKRRLPQLTNPDIFPNGLDGWPTKQYLAGWDAQYSDNEQYSDEEAPYS